jgi:lambda family phage portal protein
MGNSTILDSSGAPMRRLAMSTPYTAADRYSQELSTWHPGLGSANSDYAWDRDTIVSRQRDLVRNSGWASGAVSKHLDNVIGASFRLSAKPDFGALGLAAEWAAEWAEGVEARWRLYAEDPDHWIDATRQQNFSGLLGLAFRHDFVDGESFGIVLWLDSKPFGRYATTVQIIDPDRVSNPNGQADSETLRSGIELDVYGAPVAYHVRLAHPGDYTAGNRAYQWERVARELPWGRRRMLHSLEKQRAGQVRGISPFAPIVERLKMLDKYDRIELQAALVNAIFAAFIESPFDHELIDEALSADKLNSYQTARADFHEKRQVALNSGVRIPTLFPGEKLNFQAASRPASQFGEFEKACLRNIAAGLGLSYEQLSQDWSSTNYSSARAALLEVWKSFGRTRQRMAEQFATPLFVQWLEEGINRGDITLPDGAPDFYTAKAAYCRVKWIGPARGWVDPVKEVQAAQMRMDTGISTLEDECADQGKDWQEVLQQRAREIAAMDKLGLKRPAWADHAPPKDAGPDEAAPQNARGAHG